jgi:hypothetical protein
MSKAKFVGFLSLLCLIFVIWVTGASAQGPAPAPAPGGAAAGNNGIFLLEPIGGVREIPTNGGGLGAFGFYIGLLYPWLIGVSAGVAVLMALWGGVEIIQSGGDSGKRDEGKKRLIGSLMGLLLILLSATILNAINPVFFR